MYPIGIDATHQIIEHGRKAKVEGLGRVCAKCWQKASSSIDPASKLNSSSFSFKAKKFTLPGYVRSQLCHAFVCNLVILLHT